MNCQKCGNGLDNDSKFCIKCGEKVNVKTSNNAKAKYCEHCGAKKEKGDKFCQSCGKATSAADQAILSTASYSNQTGITPEALIKCGNCEYIGPGEPARSLWAKILAWFCVFFAPMITIIYFVATSKYRCPRCKSTFLGVKNEHGVFVAQRGGSSRAVIIFICILVSVAIIGILASVVLASLNTARAKGADAAIKANLSSARAQAELYYDKNGDSYKGVCTNTEGVLSMKNSVSEASGSDAICNDTPKTWAMSSTLKTNKDKIWCVDSLGTSEEIFEGIGQRTSCSSVNFWGTTNTNDTPELTGAQICARDLPNSTWDGKSYTSDGSYGCSCKNGYEWNTAGTACITPDQSCNNQFPNSYSVGNNTCDCKTGYIWNSNQTACY